MFVGFEGVLLCEIVSPAAFRDSFVTAMCAGDMDSEHLYTGDSLGFITIWSLSRLFRYTFKTTLTTATTTTTAATAAAAAAVATTTSTTTTTTTTNTTSNATGGGGEKGGGGGLADVKKGTEIGIAGVAAATTTNVVPVEKLSNASTSSSSSSSHHVPPPHLENAKLITMIVCWKAHVNRIVALMHASNGLLFSASVDESVR